MKVHKLTVLIIDHDELGSEGVKRVLEYQKYPNHCISPHVEQIESYDIGEWEDRHPMNLKSTDKLQWLAEHGKLVMTEPEMIAEVNRRVSEDMREMIASARRVKYDLDPDGRLVVMVQRPTEVHTITLHFELENR